jgi:hypothetical protein
MMAAAVVAVNAKGKLFVRMTVMKSPERLLDYLLLFRGG